VSLDDVDRQILSLLRENARESFTAIAERVKTSEGTVRSRVKRMTDDGTIRQFTIRTAGSHVKALVEVSVTNNVHTADVAAKIRSWDGVESVWEVTGDNDIVVVADCPNTTDLNAIIDRIRDIQGTQATRSRLILKEH
jgi:Lrp/AsnC family transcriptional regulator for asnA, asnC and gidA